ncbi:MAG TPA: ABC transporter substrate-binding protein [Gammaproteobacteria bacterium]|jgi:phospholipid transport system substrate-binding protein|nr:ABC transporter substrate-binding protein [Gammaproteobacteria bacterium]
MKKRLSYFKKGMLVFSVMLASCFVWLNASAAPQSQPVALLQYIADNMIAGLKANKATLKSKPSIVYKLAYQYVVPYADLGEMSKRVLPPAVWKSATPEQRSRFQKEFTRTVIRTYASALTSYEDQTIQFFPVRGGSQGRNTVEVNSRISGSQGDPISVSYRLINRGGSWRLYDMSVEGVDMLESFRAQFADILAQGNIETLLQRMSGRNSR